MKPLSKRLQGVIEILDGRIDWERRDRGSMRQDLSPMEDLMARMGHPTRAFRTIHVAGSKGKGSVCALIAAGMTAAGVRVGRYGSPLVERLTERVEVCGREVADDLLAGALEEALEACQAASSAGSPGESATWFDLLTAAAFACFAKQELEWVVVEVGLGGRLDSTNVVHGEVAVITTIELEHVELLGSTRGQIAGEKAGIIDTGAVVVCGPPPGDEAGDVIRARAEDVGARVVDVAGAEGITETNRALAGEALEPGRELWALQRQARREHLAGRYGEAARILEDVLDRSPDQPQAAYNLACALARNGKRERALERLEHAVELGFRDLGTLVLDPDLESVRSEDGYLRLLERLDPDGRSSSEAPKSSR